MIPFGMVVPEDFGEVPPIHRDTLYNATEGKYSMEVYDTNGCRAVAKPNELSQPTATGIMALPDTTYGDYQIKCNGENSGRLGYCKQQV